MKTLEQQELLDYFCSGFPITALLERSWKKIMALCRSIIKFCNFFGMPSTTFQIIWIYSPKKYVNCVFKINVENWVLDTIPYSTLYSFCIVNNLLYVNIFFWLINSLDKKQDYMMIILKQIEYIVKSDIIYAFVNIICLLMHL